MRKLAHPKKAGMDAVFALIRNAAPVISEGIKWNAPSFCADGSRISIWREFKMPDNPQIIQPATSISDQVDAVLQWLNAHATKATLDGMARYAIPSDNAVGVAMKDMKVLGNRLGRNHGLALALWETGVYEARMVVSLVGDPLKITSAEMDRWCKDIDNWAYCDTLCFNLFDRTPHAWKKVSQWSKRREEFVKRTAFALLWSLALHDRQSADAEFLTGLKLIKAAATDERNFVKKAVSMALKAIGKRRGPALKSAAVASAQRLAESTDPTARWIGRDARREFAKRA